MTVEARRPRRATTATPGPPATPSPATTAPSPAPPATAANQPFAPLSTVTSNEIGASTGQSFGNLLFTTPGATSAGLAPGVGRPILRGLADAKVRIQENGVGTVDVSDIAQDHAVPIDPLALQRTEIFRGPEALRFGSQAIGGIVDASNNRIPTAAPAGGVAAEMRAATTTVDRGWESGLLLDAGDRNVAVHADVYGRNAGNYAIPSYPYLVPPNPAPVVNGEQPNSALHSEGAAVGGSYLFGSGGYAGVAISRFASDYHVAGIASAKDQQHNRLEQTKISSKGEFHPDAPAVAAIRYWAGYSDYKHDEIDQTGLGFEEIGASFKNRTSEGKAEFEFAPLSTPIGASTTTIGAQGTYQQLDTSGQAILFPATTKNAAGYLFNEIRHTDTLRTQVAGRIETVNVSGTSVAFPSDFLPLPDILTSSPATRSFTPKSISFSAIKDLPSWLAASLTLQRIERAPRALELFAEGADDSEKTFKIGDPNLKIETGNTAEIGLKRTAGDFRFDAKAYYAYYDQFIFAQTTGTLCDANFSSCGTGTNYIQVAYGQRNAIFRGGELAWQWDVTPLSNGTFGLDGQFDAVRATFTDGSNVPRIPPMRGGGGAYWRNGEWFVRMGLLHAFAQNDFAAFDTPTPGYNLLKLQIERHRFWKDSPWGPVDVTSGIIGDNLLNADVRNSVQFHKDEILQPGRNFKFFVNVKYGGDAPSGRPDARAAAGNAYSAPVTYKAPVFAPAWNWTGPYLGGNAGYGWGRTIAESALNGAAGNPLFGGKPSSRLDGAILGGTAGYNWLAGVWVAGIEGDLQYPSQRASLAFVCPGNVCNPALAPLDPLVTASLEHKLGWLATLRGRLGATVSPDTLAYVTAGVPLGAITVAGTVSGFDAAGNAIGTGFSSQTIRAGWTIGVGLERHLTGNWTGKIEYLHMDFGSIRTFPMNATATVAADFNSRIADDLLRVGFNYKLEPAAVVAARN
jgi:iron complex outermembrane receptor protein